MTVNSFAIDSVITGLAAALDTALDVPVFDGAIVAGDSNFSCVVVGSDGDPAGAQRPARFTSDWHDFDMTTDEVGQIQCAVVVWSGDANPATFADQRGTAVGILQDIDQALRASVTASQLGVDQLLWSKVDSGEVTQALIVDNDGLPKGTETRLPFVYGYKALLVRT